MRRRVVRLVMLALIVPAAGWAAEELAKRLEAHRGPSPASHVLRGAGALARRRRSRWF